MQMLDAVVERAQGSKQAAALPVSLEEYYSEAGPDYAAWSRAFNMHFGYFRLGMNPLRREPMLEQMNREVLDRLRIDPAAPSRLLDLGCGLGATLRSFARRLPRAELTGITRVAWQVDRATEWNAAEADTCRIRIRLGDYQKTELPAGTLDGVYALESSCYARAASKAELLAEAHRLLRPGGRLVVADGFLRSSGPMGELRRRIYRKLRECWVIDTLGELDLFTRELRHLGFQDVFVEDLQYRVAPSVAHIPWVTVKFLITDVLFGKTPMTRARWNNIIAPLLLPWVGMPGGPMVYCMVSATKAS